MLWYLLYPFRGAASAPDLPPGHPVRRICTRYGLAVARNIGLTFVISVAVITALLYPIPFLYSSDFSNGASSLPYHVWTSARPLKDGTSAEPDVIMRSVWVHGNYMAALDRHVLLGALDLQDSLLGPTKNFSPRRTEPPPHSDTLDGEARSHEVLATNLSPELRDALHVVNGLTNQSWFFHSPLLYWSNDRDTISSDPDILATVNAHKAQPTSINVTLRHSVVFSGKRYQDRILMAADALVITLIHLRDSPVGRQWELRAADLAEHAARDTDTWSVYPKNATSLSSQLVEFQFLPISTQDIAMLTIAYAVTFVYLVQNLSRLPTIKSRPGLIIAVVIQIFVSIMSSFTICAILRVDLSRIPHAAYPIVAMSMSLENILRLIKSVIATNWEDSTSSRIAEAFGKTIYVALISVLEHLVLIWGLSKLVSSGLYDFCVFLAIAIVFDFFYLSTLFLSVLSIEVRRTELGEAIDKATSERRLRLRSLREHALSPLASSTWTWAAATTATTTAYASSFPPQLLHQDASVNRSPRRPSWLIALLQGRVDASTRTAGTVILLGFVVIAQWHFFGEESLSNALRRLFFSAFSLDSSGKGGTSSSSSGNFDSGGTASASSTAIGTGGYNLTTWASSTSQFEEVHQARSPTSWLRMQDHETAREVIHVVKPWAHSYVAQVYEPLVFVLQGADRMTATTERWFLPAVYDFARHQATPFLVTIVVTAAIVRIFVNYLLWDEITEASAAADADAGAGSTTTMPVATDAAAGTGYGSALSVKTLDAGHALDIALLAASPDGLVVTVGLDRCIRVWNVPFDGMSYVIAGPAGHYPGAGGPDASVPPVDGSVALFPVYALVIDDDSNWLAILSSYQVSLWNLEQKRWGRCFPVDLYGQKQPEAFFFMQNQEGAGSLTVPSPVVLVRRNGTLAELWSDTGDVVDHPICRSPLLCAVPLLSSGAGTTLLPKRQTLSILTVSRSGCIHRVTPVGDRWLSEEIKGQQLGGGSDPSLRLESAQSVVALPPLFSAYLVVRPGSVDLVNLTTSEVIRTLVATAPPIKARSLRVLYGLRKLSQLQRQQLQQQVQHQQPLSRPAPSPQLAYFSIAYTGGATGNCVIQTYLPVQEGGGIEFSVQAGLGSSVGSSAGSGGAVGSPTTPSRHYDKCCSWDEARQFTRQVANPGKWEALHNGCVIGVRRRQEEDGEAMDTKSMGAGMTGTAGMTSSAAGRDWLDNTGFKLLESTSSSLRWRGLRPAVNSSVSRSMSAAKTSRSVAASPSADGRNGDGWEAWSICNVADSYGASERTWAGSVGSGDGDGDGNNMDEGGDGDGGIAGLAAAATETSGSTATCSAKEKSGTRSRRQPFVVRSLDADADELLVTEPGPMACVGAGTVALGFGTAIKIITMDKSCVDDHARFGTPAEMLEAAAAAVASSRRRKNRSLQKGGRGGIFDGDETWLR